MQIKQLFDWNLQPREPSRPRTLMYRKTRVTKKKKLYANKLRM